jgi:hypothetical protein
MNNQYIFVPKNPMLRHCSDSFSSALRNQADNYTVIHCATIVNLKTIWNLLYQVFQSKPDDRYSVFFLAIQSDYLALLYLLKLVAALLAKNIRVYYLMHEPRLEKGQAHPIKSFIIFIYQLLFGYLADIILLPSDEGIVKAEMFVRKDKICKMNLAFLSVPQETLEKNLQLLKCSWDKRKVFSMLGTVSALSKNPQGFLDFANIVNQLYPQQAQFIRGGRDRNIDVQYNEDIIIRFPNYLSDTAKSFLFNLSHFIVVPYLSSNQSGVIAEALSYGKLLIVNDIPAFSYLKGLDFAYLVDFNDETAILNCIHNLFIMNIIDYEKRYWEAVNYFRENHSEIYLLRAFKNDCKSNLYQKLV